MHIILLILKIIGIILLSLLGLLLVLILLVLFVSVRYDAKGEKYEKTVVKASVHWLLHLVHLSVIYNDAGGKIGLRIFGIPVWKTVFGEKESSDRKEASVIRKPADANRFGRENMSSGADQSFENETDVFDGADQSFESETDVSDGTEQSFESETDVSDGIEQSFESEWNAFDETEDDISGFFEEENADFQDTVQRFENTRNDTSEEKSSKKKQSLVKRIHNLINAFKDTVRKLGERLKSLKSGIHNLKETIQTFLRWWEQDTTQKAFQSVRGELRTMLRHILPVKYEISLHIGTGDPASTGQLLGVFGILYSFTKGQLSITPEFEDKVLEGKFWLKGRIRMGKLLNSVLKVVFDKNVQTAVKCWQNRI